MQPAIPSPQDSRILPFIFTFPLLWRSQFNKQWKAHLYEMVINPFLPTGQFMAPKLIILIKCLIDILFFKVLF